MIDFSALQAQAAPLPAEGGGGSGGDPGYYWSDPGWKNPYQLPWTSHGASASVNPPSYWWTDPSGNPRPGTAPVPDAGGQPTADPLAGIAAAVGRRVTAMLHGYSRPFQPTAVPGWLQQLQPAPNPGTAFLHRDPMYQASVARRQAMLMRPIPTIRRGRPLNLQHETPGIGFNRPGIGIGNLHPATPGAGHVRPGPGIEALNPGLGF